MRRGQACVQGTVTGAPRVLQHVHLTTIINIAVPLGFVNLTDCTSYTYLILMSTGATDAAGQKHLILEPTNKSINVAYLVIVAIGVPGLVLSSSSRRPSQEGSLQ